MTAVKDLDDNSSDLVVDNSDDNSSDLDTFLRLPDVMRRVGLSKTTIYDLAAKDPPRFPKPAKIGDGQTVGWSSREIAVWQRAKLAARGAPR
jgi:predicted DNA-binding transcriptional regulator AlpA